MTREPNGPGGECASFLQFAREIAREAGELTLKWFRNDPETQYKEDQTPVTIADREAESLLRTRIHERYPDHAILGEEHGYEPGSGDWTWILDPIDGTKSFVLGVPLYAVLVALVQGSYDGTGDMSSDRVRLGVVYVPPLHEMVSACRGNGAVWTVNGTDVVARVSSHDSLSGARIGTTDFADLEREAPNTFAAVLSSGGLTRTWGDAYGYLLVATGRHEAMIDPRVSPWDIGPLPVIVEEAGGRLTDLSGARIFGSSVLASNGGMHGDLLNH